MSSDNSSEAGEVLDADPHVPGVALEPVGEAPPPVVRMAAGPGVQAAAVAATGFIAGAAAAVMVGRRRSRLPRLRRAGKRRSALGQVVSSNSFLVDVHVLRRH